MKKEMKWDLLANADSKEYERVAAINHRPGSINKGLKFRRAQRTNLSQNRAPLYLQNKLICILIGAGWTMGSLGPFFALGAPISLKPALNHFTFLISFFLPQVSCCLPLG